MEDYYSKCRECKNFGTCGCPNSSKCFDTTTKPYFEQKEKESKKDRFSKWMKRTIRNLFS